MTIGWKLDEKCRQTLLERFPPRYSEVVADKVALMPDGGGDLPAPVLDARLVGHADDGRGMEAMVIALYGSIDRFDGNRWHIPWSHAHGRDAAETRDLLGQMAWSELEHVPLRLHPAKW